MTTYKESGVDIDLADRFVDLIKPLALSTRQSGASIEHISGIGGFAAAARALGIVIGASTDGVGQKVRLAAFLNQIDTIGQDLVAMSANDLWAGMEPTASFFLDYYAVGKLRLAEGERVIGSIARACREIGAVLLGGETAEMRHVYREHEFDLAGTIIGLAKSVHAVAQPALDVFPGTSVWGFPSSGVHANGFGLIHRVFGIDYGDEDATRKKLGTCYPELGCTLGAELLKPTLLYPRLVSRLRRECERPIAAFAHITGGGMIRNVRRILPDGCTAVINMGACRRPAIFDLIERVGGVKWLEMYRTFNCGIGLVAITAADLSREGAVKIGEIKAGNFGDKSLVLCTA